MHELIAIVDDEPDIVELVSLHLEKAGFKVRGFGEGESLFGFLDEQQPDLIILDLMLPDADGIEICKKLKMNKEFSALPIIMLTARSDETDKVLGLELGADDYVTKPFSPKELVARVKAVLRRKEQREPPKKMAIGTMVELDPGRHEVTVEGKQAPLTSTEFRVLQILASRPGWVFSRDQILDYLWGHEKTVLHRTVDVHIRNLREKLGKAADLIKNVRGVGYKLEE